MAEVASGTLVDGRYLIKDRIGAGGMADVYCADDRQLGREVALKMLHRRFAADDEFVERFRREASAAAGLQHPNVVGIFDRGRHDGTYYIAMENLRGRTLKQLIQDEAPLAQTRAIDLAVQILAAAGFAHAHGVVHRDFKPHNVIVGDDDRLKVTDFGIARAGASEMTETGSIMGTAHYLSPEQAQGQHVEGASDLYSIGVILFELLTGRVPFHGDSAVAIALKHVSEQAPPLRSVRPDVHPLLEAAVARALDKDPARRFRDAGEFAAALLAARAAIVAGDGGGPDVLPPPPDERGRRWPFVLLALLLLAIAAVAIALSMAGGAAQVRVPSVVGMSQRRAAETVLRAGLRPVARGVPANARPNTVVGEDPTAGSSADKGSQVTLKVSTGPAKTIVPPVAGEPRAQALEAIRSAGLTADISQTPSDTVPRDLAIGTSPPNGTALNKGAHVQLQISSGQQLVTIPDMTGHQESDAIATLDGLGLHTATTSTNSFQPSGDVLSQTPAPGTSVPKGTGVTLTVSKGPPLVTVPSVTGQDVASARAQLTGAGFNVQVVRKPSNKPDGTVLSESPQGDQPKGTTVTLTVSRQKAPSGGGGNAQPGSQQP